jgi:hypothetical protein
MSTIAKLREITQERGATAAEELAAQKRINAILESQLNQTAKEAA